MAKMYKKNECEFINGLIVNNGEVVPVPKTVSALFDIVEGKLQEAEYLLAQPEFHEAPSLKGFERKHSGELPLVAKPETPYSDEKVERAMKIMEETDKVNEVGRINGMITELKPLFDWVSSEYVVEAEFAGEPLDTPSLGNPLELTADKLVEVITTICNASDITLAGE